MSIIENPLFVTAVEGIALRAEFRDQSSNVYIDTGQLSKIKGTDNQIVYGRRGTGKTHLLQAFQSDAKENTLAVFIDLRKTQDAPVSFHGNPEVASTAALKSFQKIISLLGDQYLKYLEELIKSNNYSAEGTPDEVVELVSTLIDYSKGDWHISELVEYSDTRLNEIINTDTNSGNVTLSLGKSPSLGLGLTNEQTGQVKENITQGSKVKGELRISFSKIISTLEEINKLLSLEKTILLLDEWSFISLDLQPYLAEWLKRSFMSSPKFCLKIACIRYQSNFSFNSASSRIGFELNGDIFVGVDLDDILVFDKNKFSVIYFFTKLLFNHLEKAHKILIDPSVNSTRFVNDIFSEKRAFEELIKASEGIPRDFLHMFLSSYRKVQEHPSWSSIGVPAVVDAAKDFYHRDKLMDVPQEHQEIMESLVNEVIKHRKVKAFLVTQRLSNSIALQELMTARLLHRWHIGYAAKKSNVGERYDIYAIDYGAYVDLRETNIGRELDESMFEDEDQYSNQEVPPTVDKRAVRHIVLEEEQLEKYNLILEGAIECPNPQCHTKFSPKQKSYIIKGLCPNCFEPVPK
ncbi:hypothetical protein IEN91_20035 [Bacillus velezensis]|uniref:hypothetical protein n=1 Tax=Bacillus velezensis TaxID=492670 RepID=UPI0018C519CA|nr:hypothetical protein [Bacillus velezensis]QPK88848.1 hypothetical protein IEN91_20035 [Bacillus velezensis]